MTLNQRILLYSCQRTPSYEAASGIALHSNLINAVERGLSDHYYC